jgi:hypothetical protein
LLDSGNGVSVGLLIKQCSSGQKNHGWLNLLDITGKFSQILNLTLKSAKIDLFLQKKHLGVSLGSRL